MGTNNLNYDISKRYSHELADISNKLNQLEKGRIYEFSGATMDGRLSTNVGQLREMITELLNKIQNDEEGFSGRIGEIMNQISE